MRDGGFSRPSSTLFLFLFFYESVHIIYILLFKIFWHSGFHFTLVCMLMRVHGVDRKTLSDWLLQEKKHKCWGVYLRISVLFWREKRFKGRIFTINCCSAGVNTCECTDWGSEVRSASYTELLLWVVCVFSLCFHCWAWRSVSVCVHVLKNDDCKIRQFWIYKILCFNAIWILHCSVLQYYISILINCAALICITCHESLIKSKVDMGLFYGFFINIISI